MPHRFSPRSTRAVRLPLHPRPRRRRRRLSENDLVETLMTTYDVDWDMAHGVLSYLGPESISGPPCFTRFWTGENIVHPSLKISSALGGKFARHIGRVCCTPISRSSFTHAWWNMCEHSRVCVGASERRSKQITHSPWWSFSLSRRRRGCGCIFFITSVL